MTPKQIDLVQQGWALSLGIVAAALLYSIALASDPAVQAAVGLELAELRRRMQRMTDAWGRSLASLGYAFIWAQVQRRADGLVVLCILLLFPSWCASACLAYWHYLSGELAMRLSGCEARAQRCVQ